MLVTFATDQINGTLTESPASFMISSQAVGIGSLYDSSEK